MFMVYQNYRTANMTLRYQKNLKGLTIRMELIINKKTKTSSSINAFVLLSCFISFVSIKNMIGVKKSRYINTSL